MHLPFTFATGEALLYQTGFPLHGFPDAAQGKARGAKSKKGKPAAAAAAADHLDPKSLLGALMSQDGSVYVCQPDGEQHQADGKDTPQKLQSKLKSNLFLHLK